MSDSGAGQELLGRINTFLYEEEQLTEADLSRDLAQVAEETGLPGEKVLAVVKSVLGIMEKRRKERGIDYSQEGGVAFPAYIVRRHAGIRRFWGGRLELI